ncbi:MAG: integrase [Chaetfec virus UA24_244]|nr:MAG: integrase [Chaetfec virus UA24_244]
MDQEKKICAAYIRVSTHDQEEYSPESQIKILRDYAKAHHMVLPEEFIFRDDGISGRNVKKRTAFQEMIAAAKSEDRPFEAILVWKFSRFARNQEEAIVYKSMLRKNCGVDVISISEPIMDGPFGSLIERIIEWQDEYYSINLGTEVRRGMAERAGRGLPVSAAPLGYSYQNKELAIVPEEAEAVRMIYRDFLSGTPMIAIAKKLNAMGIRTKRGGTWENRTVRYILTNPIYIGKIRWCKNGANDYHNSHRLDSSIEVDGEHEAIIDRTVYDAAQKKIEEYLTRYKGSAAKAQRQNVTHMLQGLVKCGSCGGTMTYTGTGMNCSKYVHGKCTVSHFILRKKLEDWVLSSIKSHFGSLDFEVVRRSAPQRENDDHLLRQQLKRAEEILRRHKEAYANGIDSLEEYRANKQEDMERVESIKKKLKAVTAPAPVEKKRFADNHREALASLSDPALSPQEKNAVLRSFVDEIVYSKDADSLSIRYYVE